MTGIHPFRHPRRVYCAGPLFNEPERQEMLRIAAAVADAGFEPFVPHADGMEFAQVHPYLAGRGYDPVQIGQILHRAVFALDVYQVVLGCGSIILNMNGRVPDEGAVAEAAIAWTLGKPLVIFKADARSKIAGRDNPLVAGMTDFQLVSEIDQLGARLAERLLALGLDADRELPCPPHLAHTLDAGQRLWQRLANLGSERPSDAVSEIVLELFDSPSTFAGQSVA